MQNQIPKKLYILVPDKPSQIQAESASAASIISSVIRTCLGPKAMQKMVITKINSIEITNDGNSILRELDVSHPSARCIIELARTQDDEVGDGTTSVVILAAEILQGMSALLSRGKHPIRVCNYLSSALKVFLDTLENLSVDIGNNKDDVIRIIKSSIETKMCNMLKIPVELLAYDAVKFVYNPENGIYDLKNNVKVEKILGGSLQHSEVIDGVILNKDIIHPQMRKHIVNPRIIIIDSPLEYKKGESQTNFEFSGKMDFTKALELEEQQIRTMCGYITELKPDIVVCEKGISDLALAILHENNITGIRRLKKTDSVRLSKASGATIVTRLEDIEEKHVGLNCKLFEYLKYGEEYYCKFSKCDNPKACSVVIRGPTKDIMNEIERNFQDALKVAKNIMMSPKLVPGGGCVEMNVYKALLNTKTENELEREVYEALAESLKIIPSILLANSGVHNSLQKLSLLEESIVYNKFNGVNGVTGEIEDMKDVILEPYAVKKQSFVSAVQSVLQLLRVDGIIESKR